MKKITIKNYKTLEVTHGATFDTQIQLEEWKNKHINKNTWGLPERWQVDRPSNPVLESDKQESLDTREYTDESGTYIEYLLPCQYLIVEEEYEIPYTDKRLEEYRRIDEFRIEAMVEKELGDDTKWNEYLALREQIKEKYPKPE